MSPVWRKEHEVARVVVHFIGMIVFSIGMSAVCGQLAGRPALYEWGFAGQMSLPTAVCLCLSGIGFFLVSRGEAGHADGG